MIDTIIIGCGPAGTTCALYLQRFGRSTLMIGEDKGSLKETTVANYYGYYEIDGKQLVENGIKQVVQHGGKYIKESVISIKENEEFFIVTTNKKEYYGKTVVLATGRKATTLKIPGYDSFYKKGISTCSICDGYFFKNKKIALIGNKKYMEYELNILKDLTKDITIFSQGSKLNIKGFNVITDKVIEFVGNTHLIGIKTKKGEYKFDGCFVAVSTPSSLELASNLGIICEENHVVVNENFETSCTGIYACGDVIGGVSQITKVSYDGMMTAISIEKTLHK